MSQHIEEDLPIDLPNDEPLEPVLNTTVYSDDRSESLENQAARKSSVMEILAKQGFSWKVFAMIMVVLCLPTTSLAA